MLCPVIKKKPSRKYVTFDEKIAHHVLHHGASRHRRLRGEKEIYANGIVPT